MSGYQPEEEKGGPQAGGKGAGDDYAGGERQRGGGGYQADKKDLEPASQKDPADEAKERGKKERELTKVARRVRQMGVSVVQKRDQK